MMKLKKWFIRLLAVALIVFGVINIIWGAYYFRVKKVYDRQMEKCGVEEATIGGYHYFVQLPQYLKYNGFCCCYDYDMDKQNIKVGDTAYWQEIWIFYPAFGRPIVASELKEFGHATWLDGRDVIETVNQSYTEWNERMEVKIGDESAWKRAEPDYREILQRCYDMWGFFGEYLGE